MLAPTSADFDFELEYMCFDGAFGISSSKVILSDLRLPPTNGPGTTTFSTLNEKALATLGVLPQTPFPKSHQLMLHC